MSDTWLRRMGWGTAVLSLLILTLATILLWLVPDQFSLDGQVIQVRAISALGAPVLGLLILNKQPRQRVGWLWIIYGLAVGSMSLGNAIYYYSGAQATGYSAPAYFLLWVTEPANITQLICLILLILWFPDGLLASRGWRFLHIWQFLAVVGIGYNWFMVGPNWNGGELAGGIIIENPYGRLPEVEGTGNWFGFLGFISIVLITILALVALVLRYRSAGQVMRLQLRWFVFGGVIHVILNYILLPLNSPGQQQMSPAMAYEWRWLILLSQTAIVPLYLAVGIAILRYRLYDIELIIRKTLQYTVLSALLALVYFGNVVLLQSLFGAALADSPPLIVLSTLLIAALFNPLRRHLQAGIDRRFYRSRYDAQEVLARFAQTARDETELSQITGALVNIVRETLQPTHVSLWLPPDEPRRKPQATDNLPTSTPNPDVS